MKQFFKELGILALIILGAEIVWLLIAFMLGALDTEAFFNY